MKEKVDSLGFASYWWTLLIGGSVTLLDCLVIPGWEYDTVYRSDPKRPEGPGRIWHFQSRYEFWASKLKQLRFKSPETLRRISEWFVGQRRLARLTRFLLGAALAILIEIGVKSLFFAVTQ